MGNLRKSDVQQEAGHQNGGPRTSIGFMLACIGSAVGMGNIWMSPYRVGQYGGTIFLVPCTLFIVLLGLVGPSAELATGRRAKTGVLRAYEYYQKSRNLGKLGYVLGWISLTGPPGIVVGCAIIVGRVVRLLVGSLTRGILTADAAEYLGRATGNFGSVSWHVIVILIAYGLLMSGATKGIEKVSRVLTPPFLTPFAILTIQVAFLPGAVNGYESLFVPGWGALLKVDARVMAMGQALFLLSVTSSGMIVYGTYLSRSEGVPKTSVRTTFFDTMAAVLSALVIMPAVFTFGIKPNVGPPLMFITLLNIFKQMPMGRLFTVLFFLSVIFARVTDLTNMFEAVNELWQTRSQPTRRKAMALCGDTALLVDIFLEAEPKVGFWMDFIIIVVVPFGAVLGAVSIYHILGFDEIKKELELGQDKPLGKYFGPLTEYVYVPLAIIVFVLGLAYGGIG